jgi:hypothetical protein
VGFLDWKNKLPDFELRKGEISSLLLQKGIQTFHEACVYVSELPYRRTKNRDDLTAVLTEKGGTCSSKHGLLGQICVENGYENIELIAGVFLMSSETHPSIETILDANNLTILPEMHCYLRFKGERFDFTSPHANFEKIASKIVREQWIEPHQVGDWKVKIHQSYLESWLERNPQIHYTLEQLWEIREKCIEEFSASGF